MNAHFVGHADEILSAMHEAAITALEAVGIKAEGYAKKGAKVDPGGRTVSVNAPLDVIPVFVRNRA